FAFLIEIAGVFAPVGRRLVPGQPQAAVVVACEADVRAKQPAAGRQNDIAALRLRPAGQAADPHVVVTVVLGIPADPDAIFLRIVSNRRVPVVTFTLGDLDRVVPAVGISTAGVDVALAVLEALPDQPGAALVVGRHPVPQVGTGTVGQLDFFAELAVLV